MTGEKVNNYSQVDTNILENQLTQDANFKGKHLVSLTNYDNTALPAIAAGSIVEVNGALFEFDTEEAIGGSPSNGTVYIVIIPSTTTCTAQFTNTAPTWSDSKQGWYGTGGSANYRYLEFKMTKATSSYSNKIRFTHDDNIDRMDFQRSDIIDTNITTADITTVNISSKIVMGGSTTIENLSGVPIFAYDTGNSVLYLSRISGTTDSSGNLTVAHNITNGSTRILDVRASYITSSTRYYITAAISCTDTNVVISSSATTKLHYISILYV